MTSIGYYRVPEKNLVMGGQFGGSEGRFSPKICPGKSQNAPEQGSTKVRKLTHTALPGQILGENRPSDPPN